MKKEKTKEQKLRSFLIPKLRRASYMWSERNNAKKTARVHIPIGKFKNGNTKFKSEYKCASCTKTFNEKEIHVDHIKPVIDPKVGFTTWDSYINNMFCDSKNLQILCEDCHSVKSQKENKRRKKNARKTK